VFGFIHWAISTAYRWSTSEDISGQNLLAILEPISVGLLNYKGSSGQKFPKQREDQSIPPDHSEGQQFEWSPNQSRRQPLIWNLFGAREYIRDRRQQTARRGPPKDLTGSPVQGTHRRIWCDKILKVE
jgi:hypothetical protein